MQIKVRKRSFWDFKYYFIWTYILINYKHKISIVSEVNKIQLIRTKNMQMSQPWLSPSPHHHPGLGKNIPLHLESLVSYWKKKKGQQYRVKIMLACNNRRNFYSGKILSRHCIYKKIHWTRTRADQHKWFPHLACINKMPLLFYKFIVNSKNDSKIWKKEAFH